MPSSTPRRIIIRPRIQIAILVVIFLVFAVIGLGYFTREDVLPKRDWFGVVLGVVCTVGGALGIWRSLRMGVVIDANGIRERGLDRRDRVTPWSAVRSIVCDQISVRAGRPIYAPVIRLAGQPGGEIPVRTLSSYSRADADRKAERLRGLSGNTVSATADDPDEAKPAEPVSLDLVRLAPSYPRMVLAARLYAGSFAWLLVVGVVVTRPGVGPWWLLLCVPFAPLLGGGHRVGRRPLSPTTWLGGRRHQRAESGIGSEFSRE